MKYDFTTFNTAVTDTHSWLANEYIQIHTGQISAAVLDGVNVLTYGTESPLRNCASINLENQRTLLVLPYDTALTKDIEKALTYALPSMSITVSDTGIRVVASEMIGERRAMLETTIKKKAEDARQSIRGAREKVLTDIKKKKSAKEISEDEEMGIKKDLQKHVDLANEKIEKMRTNKLKDIQS